MSYKSLPFFLYLPEQRAGWFPSSLLLYGDCLILGDLKPGCSVVRWKCSSLLDVGAPDSALASIALHHSTSLVVSIVCYWYGRKRVLLVFASCRIPARGG